MTLESEKKMWSSELQNLVRLAKEEGYRQGYVAGLREAKEMADHCLSDLLDQKSQGCNAN